MNKYIDWNKITDRMKVKLVGKPGARHYEAGGRIVLMNGQNQRGIQKFLDARVKKDAQKFRKR